MLDLGKMAQGLGARTVDSVTFVNLHRKSLEHLQNCSEVVIVFANFSTYGCEIHTKKKLAVKLYINEVKMKVLQ